MTQVQAQALRIEEVALNCQQLVKIDRKVAKATMDMSRISLTYEELTLLSSLGVIGMISEAKARALEEYNKWQKKRKIVPIVEGRSGSVGSPTVRLTQAGTSGGSLVAGKNAEARAHRTFMRHVKS